MKYDCFPNGTVEKDENIRKQTSQNPKTPIRKQFHHETRLFFQWEVEKDENIRKQTSSS